LGGDSGGPAYLGVATSRTEHAARLQVRDNADTAMRADVVVSAVRNSQSLASRCKLPPCHFGRVWWAVQAHPLLNNKLALTDVTDITSYI